jgi:hypothetical protein
MRGLHSLASNHHHVPPRLPTSSPYVLSLLTSLSQQPYTYTVNAVPHLALGLQVLGALSAAFAVSGALSFTYDTFLRPGVSVGNKH